MFVSLTDPKIHICFRFSDYVQHYSISISAHYTP